ncbi:MAG: hypothetical protein M3Z54_14710 [Gemmatimonadota bacterium]|nr:hypothetical protein [Gemmatimonadota bacterium]
MRRTNSALAGLAVLVGCHAPITIYTQLESQPHSVGCAPVECSDPSRVISITYLGVAGLLIEHRGHVLLTAPFFSNPSFAKVRPRVTRLFRSTPRISADTQAIEKLLPAAADRATAILVGHGHYDHLMDVPYIATRRAGNSKVYGGPSVRHMLMGDSTLRSGKGDRLVEIPAMAAGTKDRAGRWYYTDDSAYRFMALVAGHAPNYRAWKRSYTFTEGTLSIDRDSLPHTAAEWKLGESYAFLIDVLSDSARKPVFRIYFEDAPSEPPLGFPSRDILAERTVDLAVLCAATSTNVPNTPDSLLVVLKPSNVILAHWEDFFRSQTLPIQLGRGTDLDELRESLKKSLVRSAGWVMPLPQTTFRFREIERE